MARNPNPSFETLASQAPQDEGQYSFASTLPCLLRRLAAAVARRLIGDPRVIGAIRQAGQRLAAAEEKFRTGGAPRLPAAAGPLPLPPPPPPARRATPAN